MPNLIVHIGPGKCGSTSIQQFFGSNKNPCNEKIHFHLLDPIEIKKLNCTEPTNSTLQFFKEIIKKYSSYCDVLILSHESLFNHPDSIKHLCEVASGFTSKTSVIGYSRRQSDLLVSAYSQWFFRSLKLNKKINIDLRKMEVDTLLFSGLEKLLIAFIENDFYDDSFIILDMYRSYQKIENLIKKMNVEVFCGILPNKKYKFSLIQDFCSNANLTLRNSMNINRDRISNKKSWP